MSKLFLIPLISFALTKCHQQNDEQLDNTVWKSCGENSFSDILAFDKTHLYIKNDSIYSHQNQAFLGIIDTITHYYGERRLFIRDLKNNVARYCEQ